MYLNEQIRADLAASLLEAKGRLAELNSSRQALLDNTAEVDARYSGTVFGGQSFAPEAEKSPVDQAAFIARRIEEFDPASRKVDHFNEELRMLIGMAASAKDASRLEEVEKQISFVVNTMERNKVQPDAYTHSLLFSKSLLTDNLTEANLHLFQANQGYGARHISPADMEAFFERSLSQDNFTGLAHLANVVEALSVDTSKWRMSKFRSALDFYLNHCYDLNKVLTFTRFYTQHAKSCLAKVSVEQVMSGDEKLAAFDKVFGQLENLVDMRALFSHLVARVGSSTFIDPHSKTDPVEGLIDFFTQSEVLELSGFSAEGTTSINTADICSYFLSHADDHASFSKVAKIILKLDAGSQGSSQFSSEMI